MLNLQTINNYLKSVCSSCLDLLYSRTVPVLVVMFVSVTILLLYYVTNLQQNLYERSALENAELYTEALAEFRTLYTQEVVTTARQQGLTIRHDYKEHERAIPLPATLSMLLGESIGRRRSGAEVYLYSGYPFPWRQEDNNRLFAEQADGTQSFAKRKLLSSNRLRATKRPFQWQNTGNSPCPLGIISVLLY